MSFSVSIVVFFPKPPFTNKLITYKLNYKLKTHSLTMPFLKEVKETHHWHGVASEYRTLL